MLVSDPPLPAFIPLDFFIWETWICDVKQRNLQLTTVSDRRRADGCPTQVDHGGKGKVGFDDFLKILEACVFLIAEL